MHLLHHLKNVFTHRRSLRPAKIRIKAMQDVFSNLNRQKLRVSKRGNSQGEKSRASNLLLLLRDYAITARQESNFLGLNFMGLKGVLYPCTATLLIAYTFPTFSSFRVSVNKLRLFNIHKSCAFFTLSPSLFTLNSEQIRGCGTERRLFYIFYVLNPIENFVSLKKSNLFSREVNRKGALIGLFYLALLKTSRYVLLKASLIFIPRNRGVSVGVGKIKYDFTTVVPAEIIAVAALIC